VSDYLDHATTVRLHAYTVKSNLLRFHQEHDPMSIEFTRTVPTFRIFDVDKAKEFYVGWLGFKVDWERQFKPNSPWYIQVSRGSLQLHLSEHHGDSTPGSVVFVEMKGIEEFHREIMAKNYKYNRPGLDQAPWNSRCVNVIDPFGNWIRFNEFNT
jgi:catechol 2,3-dioxygenase-like lactoylglutathione lyase family enzyme